MNPLIHLFSVNILVAQRICLQGGRLRFDLWVGEIPWKREGQPTPVFLPGKPHGQRTLADYSLWGHKQWNRTEFHFHFSLNSQNVY